jgi:hypothetical protein
MNKLEQKMVEAITERKPFRMSNTEFMQTRDKKNWVLVLHGNTIALFGNKKGNCKPKKISFRGWLTYTTKSRLNALDGINIRIRKGIPYLNGEKMIPHNGDEDWEDFYAVNAKATKAAKAAKADKIIKILSNYVDDPYDAEQVEALLVKTDSFDLLDEIMDELVINGFEAFHEVIKTEHDMFKKLSSLVYAIDYKTLVRSVESAQEDINAIIREHVKKIEDVYHKDSIENK